MFRIVLLLALAFAALPAQAAAQLGQAAATEKAVSILLGAPYGETRLAVKAHIKNVKLVAPGPTKCGDIDSPAWQFHVVAPGQDGYLVIDAKSGEDVCHNLGLLD